MIISCCWRSLHREHRTIFLYRRRLPFCFFFAFFIKNYDELQGTVQSTMTFDAADVSLSLFLSLFNALTIFDVKKKNIYYGLAFKIETASE